MPQGLFEQLNVAEKLVAVAGAAGLAFTTFTANTIQNEVAAQKLLLDAQKAQLELQKTQLDELKSRQELDLQLRKDAREAAKHDSELARSIFEEFVKAITDQTTPGPQRLDRLEGVLVLTYAIPEPRLQEGMGRAVQGAIERIRPRDNSTDGQRLAAAQFDAEELVSRAGSQQRVAAASPPSPAAAAAPGSRVGWSNYDFDVFYCDGVPGADALRQTAEAVVALRSRDPKASGRWRVRPLPASVNARAGYRVSGVQVRYSSADEKPLAEALRAEMAGALPGSGAQVVSTAFQTPWYLSVFVCPAS